MIPTPSCYQSMSGSKSAGGFGGFETWNWLQLL
uniref:Uncharacterized protein n=1 Tax=Rhizophora mucronata TaxID=61149 RepID=A0A2P2L9W7_RHIMU